MLSASEPVVNASGGKSITDYLHDLADVGGDAIKTYNALKGNSTATQKAVQTAIAAPTPTIQSSWFAQNKTLVLIGGAVVALGLVAAFVFRRK